MTTDDLDKVWPEHLILACPMCKHKTSRKGVVDPGIFRCGKCDIVLFPQLKNGEPRLMIGTSSFLFEPLCWHQVGRTPWSDELMTAIPLESSIKLTGLRVEPNYPGQRRIVVVSRDHEVMAWNAKGEALKSVSDALRDDAVALACWLRWEGWAHNRYMLGLVLDIVFHEGVSYVQHQMPLTSFLRGGDSVCQTASFNHLAMMAENRDLKHLQAMPWASIDNAWGLDLRPGTEVTFDHLEQLCTKWGVDSVVLKDEHYFWRFGTSRAWMIYQGGDL